MALCPQFLRGIPVHPGDPRGKAPHLRGGQSLHRRAQDNTLKSVERIALGNGYDSFIMFNVYAQRATRPDDMERTLNPQLHTENMAAFRYALEQTKSGRPAIWAAWGNIIEKRPYLPSCVRDMIAVGQDFDAQWFSAGKRSTKGHPHHPLYLRKDSPLDPFDVEDYVSHVLDHT